MTPIVLKDLSPRIGTYLAFFATDRGTRAYLWGAASHPREWLEIRDPLPQITVGRPTTPGGRDGTAEIRHYGKCVALAGLVMHRLDARRLLERLGDPTDVDVEHGLSLEHQREADDGRAERYEDRQLKGE